MAHKKGVGSSKNGRDSEAQRLGVKKFGKNRGKLIGSLKEFRSKPLPDQREEESTAIGRQDSKHNHSKPAVLFSSKHQSTFFKIEGQ